MRESRYNIWVEHAGAEYVFNGVSGALLKTPAGTRQSLADIDQGSTIGRPPVAVMERMAHGRMLVPDDLDELAMLSTRYAVTRDDPRRFGLTLVTSLGCNFDCPYCFEDKHPSIMSADVQDAVLALVDQKLPTLDSITVTWFGGEPLLGRRVIRNLGRQLIERCDAAGVDYRSAIITNGYLLDEETCLELRGLRVTFAQVSLDGPAETHDRMRPLVGGKPSFDRIVENLRHAVDYLQVGIRINADTINYALAEQLLERLADEGLAGRLSVYLGQIVGMDGGNGAPSSTYGTQCFTNPEFARASLDFAAMAAHYGFGEPSLPTPSGTPCTAVRKNEYVVGSEGELYKCWDSVGNPRDVIGSVFAVNELNSRLRKWLAYDPFADDECASCIALPVCMGGCAHHAFDLLQRENRCGTFRHTYHEQITTMIDHLERGGEREYASPVDLVRMMETR
jgi:uncharacterized protein